jgi:hypothetical protein
MWKFEEQIHRGWKSNGSGKNAVNLWPIQWRI